MLTDGGHVFVTCSNCCAFLADFHVTRPDEEDVWKVKVTCPWCGDASFITEVKGGFYPGGFGVAKPDDENEVIPSTYLELPEDVEDVFVFRAKKASNDARPIYAR